MWGASTGFYADEVLRKLTPDGTTSDLWSCEDLLDALNVDDYCGSNTIFWDEAADTFLFSLYSVDSVIEVDHATGETVRTFGHTCPTPGRSHRTSRRSGGSTAR